MVRSGRRWSVVVALLAATVGVPATGPLSQAAAATAPLRVDTPASVLAGQHLLVTGQAATGRGARVVLQQRIGRTWSPLTSASVAASGSFSLSTPAGRAPRVDTLRVERTVGHATVMSPVLTVHVVTKSFRVTAHAPVTAVAGSSVTVSGAVSPAASGTVHLQQLRNGRWVTVAAARLSRRSAYSAAVMLPAGMVQLRAVVPASTRDASGTSPAIAVAVTPAVVKPAPPASTPPVASPPVAAQPPTPAGPPVPAPPTLPQPVTAESHGEFADAANTDHVDGAGISAPLAPAWTVSDLGPPSGMALGDGLIYLAGGLDGETYVLALRPSDGSVAWGPIVVEPDPGRFNAAALLTYDDGRVFVVTTQRCTLVAYAATTGQPLWQTPTSGGTGACTAINADGGRVHVSEGGEDLTSYAEANGAELWAADVDVEGSTPAIAAGKVVAQTEPEGPPTAFDAATGKELWTASPPPVLSGGSVQVAAGKVFARTFGAESASVYDLGTGRYLHALPSMQPLALDGARDEAVSTAFLTPNPPPGCSCEEVQARSISTNRLLWHYAPPDAALRTPLVSDGVVYLTNDDGRLFELDERSGALLGSVDLHAQPATSDGYDGENTVLAAGDGLLLVSVAGGVAALRTAQPGEASSVQDERSDLVCDGPGAPASCSWPETQQTSGQDVVHLQWNEGYQIAMTVTVTGNGGTTYGQASGSDGDLSLTTGTIPAGAPFTVRVTHALSNLGFTLHLLQSQPHPQQPATATSSTSVLGFGYVPAGSVETQSYTVRNTGAYDLHLGTLAVSDPSGTTYTVVEDECSGRTLPPDWSCTVQLGAHPSGTQTVTGEADLPTDTAPVAVVLSAAGT